MSKKLSRRGLLKASAGAVAAGALGATGKAAASEDSVVVAGGIRKRSASEPEVAEALRVLGKSTLRHPGSRPFPDLPAGHDTLPGIEHIVVLQLENHSYDNFLGMLGRGKGEKPRGDGFTLGRDGRPTATTPYRDGRIQHAFRMPTTCQLGAQPSQEWRQSHEQYNDGKMNGWLETPIEPGSDKVNGPVTMGYWTKQDLPFTYSLAETFPICDRFFCSLLSQTDANRRYLIAATSSGMTDNIGTKRQNVVMDLTLPLPALGTIFTNLTAHGISWADYHVDYPLGATANLYPVPDAVPTLIWKRPFEQFYTDCANATLPQFSFLDPDFGNESQENPQNIVHGDALLAKVVRAIGSSPLWHKTLFILNYDEHGGYHDHVPPPVALAPDDIPPIPPPGEEVYDGFKRYGFRVPAIVVSPYAKRDHVSSLVYDQTSILATIERKWNLPAMTYRDANANDLFDCLDLKAMAAGKPTFASMPKLAKAGDSPARLACSVKGPGTIPPRGSISKSAQVAANRTGHAVMTSEGELVHPE